MTKDPVCGMQVDQNKAPATTSYQGQKYSFCGQDCKDKFDKEPQRYAGQSSQTYQSQSEQRPAQKQQQKDKQAQSHQEHVNR
jgi:YHS domain-containing protein